MRGHELRVLALVMAVVVGGPAGAQKPAVSSQAQNSPQAIEAREILKREADWGNALVSRDTAAFRQLTAPGFVYTENAEMMTRDQVIKGIITGEKIERAVNQNMQVHEFGPVAVVTGVFVVTSRGKNGRHTIRYRFTDTWMKAGATWKAVAAQDYVMSDWPAK